MTIRASAKFGGGGIYFSHPEQFIPFAVTAGSIGLSSVSAHVASTAAGFFTLLADTGVNVDSNFSAGVAKQVLSASGKGELFSVLGPTSGGTETTQFIITRDGATYTSPAFSVASGFRAGLMCCSLPYSGTLGGIFGDTAAGGFVPGLDATKKIVTGRLLLPNMGTPQQQAAPRMGFNTSLVVSILHSANVTGTGSQERQAGVAYRMFPTWT